MFGYPIETIYLIVLIVSGSLTFFYILLSDIFRRDFWCARSPLIEPAVSFIIFDGV